MVDAVTKPQPFTTIKYTTKDGENISATKNNGIDKCHWKILKKNW